MISLALVGCNGSDATQPERTPEIIEENNYSIVIGETEYKLYENYLVEEEIYLRSNVNVSASDKVTVKKDSTVIDVKINANSNVIAEDGVLKIRNDATSQIVLTVFEEEHYLSISGYSGPYSNLENMVKDGYVIGYSYENHISYTGYIKDGVPHGEGTYIWSMSDCIYFGQFENGKYHGEGTFVWHNGDKLVGEFAYGMPIQGEYTYASSKCTYIGTFNFDWKYEGNGVFTWPSGWRFEGNFSNGKAIYGKTITNKKTGLIWYEGAMNELNNVKSSELGYGYFIQADGTIYIGQMYSSGALETCVYSGNGTLIYADGREVTGVFANGQLISTN